MAIRYAVGAGSNGGRIMVMMTLAEVRAFAERVLADQGLAGDHVAAVADVIVSGERDGAGAHGLYRLLMCLETLREGMVATDAKPSVTLPAPALVRVDAAGGFAPLAIRLGRPHLIERARANGIAAMSIGNCAHFSALWPDIEDIARAGLVALACTSSHAWVAPAGGTQGLFGTNPLAFAWPRRDSEPMVFDFATSAAARGEIELSRQHGEALPPGWGVDRQGRPSCDPEAVLQGAMLPFGGHKGSALALMVELLAGPLIGDCTSRESMAIDGGRGLAPLGGELIVAIDPAGFLGDDVAQNLLRAEAVFEAITGQGARLPGDRRYAARRRADHVGVDVDPALLSRIDGYRTRREHGADPDLRTIGH